MKRAGWMDSLLLIYILHELLAYLRMKRARLKLHLCSVICSEGMVLIVVYLYKPFILFNFFSMWRIYLACCGH